tara:strand:+ start:186 stop:557 length:372 start_codon:yes stop_codon:yes gene_type:complete
MENYVLVKLKTIDNNTFNTLNNYINDQYISFNVKKNNNSFYFDLASNDSSFNINNYLQDKTSDLITIITYEDYKSLIDLMFNENHSIIKYNDINILQITFYCSFNTTQKKIKSLESKFKSNLV